MAQDYISPEALRVLIGAGLGGTIGYNIPNSKNVGNLANAGIGAMLGGGLGYGASYLPEEAQIAALIGGSALAGGAAYANRDELLKGMGVTFGDYDRLQTPAGWKKFQSDQGMT